MQTEKAPLDYATVLDQVHRLLLRILEKHPQRASVGNESNLQDYLQSLEWIAFVSDIERVLGVEFDKDDLGDATRWSTLPSIAQLVLRRGDTVRDA